MKNPPKSTTPAEGPVHSIRYGTISASIWLNETAKGHMYNVTFQRRYRDGDEWNSSDSFGKHDLLTVSLAATRAFEWITERMAAAPSTGAE